MTKTLNMKILTIDNIVFHGDIEKLFITTPNGQMEFLYGYAPSIVSTVPCIGTIVDDQGRKRQFFSSEGVININKNEVKFCCDSAEFKESIDIERAKNAKKRAEKRISDPSKYNIKRAELALLRANLRIKLFDSNPI